MATAKKTTRATSTKKASSPKKATSRAKSTTAPKRAAAKKTAPRAKKTVEAPQEAVQQPVEATTAPNEPQRWAVRNLTGYEFGFRLERQEKGKRRTDLKPRGQRGDWAPLKDGDLEDPQLLDQVNAGACEIIPLTEALEVSKKQTINQQRVHPALALLRNEYGEEYEDGAIRVNEVFERQGVVVAELTDGQIAIDRGGIVRPGREPISERGNQRLRRPGASPGRSPLVSQSNPALRARPGDETAAAVDAKARKKGLGGPSAGVPDGIQVTLGPTQHT